MSDSLVVRQLRAVRDLLDNVLELLGDEVELTGPCTHPPGARLPAPTMGWPNQFFCRACQLLVNGPDATAVTAPTEGGS